MRQTDKLVKFFLAPRYFKPFRTSSGMERDVCKKVLSVALNMPACDSDALMRRNPDGFHIVCTQDEFARFIIERHEKGDCINGIRDLQPEIIDGVRMDPINAIAAEFNIDPGVVRKIAEAVLDNPASVRRHLQASGVAYLTRWANDAIRRAGALPNVEASS